MIDRRPTMSTWYLLFRMESGFRMKVAYEKKTIKIRCFFSHLYLSLPYINIFCESVFIQWNFFFFCSNFSLLDHKIDVMNRFIIPFHRLSVAVFLYSTVLNSKFYLLFFFFFFRRKAAFNRNKYNEINIFD